MQALNIDNSWSFEELSRIQTSYLTHDYHKYPAKFIPQLAARLIKENSRQDDLVCDPFMGSGTTLIEAIVNGRHVYGTDINPVAVLISKAKTTPIEPSFLQNQVSRLLDKIQSDFDDHKQQSNSCKHPRIDYWFVEKQKRDLSIILARINKIRDQKVRIFLLCAFSNILKGCSRWMTKSIKPTIDKNKVPADAYKSFVLQTNRMLKKNQEFWRTVNGSQRIQCVADNRDSRKMRLRDRSVSLIVTSPPYVTSYEYADLHQLGAIWLGYVDSLSNFRNKFTGSVQKKVDDSSLFSKTGEEIVGKMARIDKREANGVRQYFFEMQQSFQEMYRVLKSGGRACIVIGDTDLKKVRIRNAEVFIETMDKIGFRFFSVIKRPIPSKILPLTRDEKTGKFTSTINSSRMAYPTEFILIMERP